MGAIATIRLASTSVSGFSWLQLADAGEYIPRLLESNVVWKPEAVGAVPRAGAVKVGPKSTREA